MVVGARGQACTTMAAASRPSPVLLEANRRLLQRRREVRAARDVDEASHASDDSAPPWAPAASATPAVTEKVPSLLPHLGWGSEPLAKSRRRARQRQKKAAQAAEAARLAWLPRDVSPAREAAKEPAQQAFSPASDTVKLYPDIGLGLLRQELAAPGRLWLLLRYLDGDGCGWLRIDIVKKQLTAPDSPLRVCGWRQLRNLLRQGRGLFWEMDSDHHGDVGPYEGRLWLRSAGKVAAALGLPRLTGRPVALPVAGLLGGIGDARAHLYAAFHSGRKGKGPDGVPMPIARSTMAEISGVSRRSQRAYEERAGVEGQYNFAVGEEVETAAAQERAWQEGTVFRLKDYEGHQGQKGKTYLAWQLPNSYAGGHQQRPKGRQKRINRRLADLFMKGMTGNGEDGVDRRQSARYDVRYYADGKRAVKGYNRHPQEDAYWPGGRASGGDFCVWQVLCGGEGR
jgi:hypothetical protein